MGADGGTEWASVALQEIWKENAAARAALVGELQGLSEKQLTFQPAPGKWSIGEILDHLCLAERSITRVLSKILQQAAGRGLIYELGTMEPLPHQIDLATYNLPADAPEFVRPLPDRALEQLLAALEESRARLLEVASRADGRVVGSVTIQHFQLGELHFYQWLALEAAHENKHLAQIRPIKAHPRFPKA